jgi:transcriptional regulator with XRE-family HTH domain
MDGRTLLAWNLRRIRVKRGLSQEGLAYDADVDRSYVGDLEREEENPTVEVLDRLAKTLGVGIAEFFRGQRGQNHCAGGEGHYVEMPMRSVNATLIVPI